MSALSQSGNEKRRLLRLKPLLLLLFGTIAIVVIAGGIWWNYAFPYGNSHSCSKGLGMDLRMYADEHHGWFPYGGKTPEQSLGFLCTNNSSACNWYMRGKHLPQSVVDQALATDGVLSPASCGWHYVEGLREQDGPKLAIVWDKVTGFNHNGMRQRHLKHEVVMSDGSIQLVSKYEWPSFVAAQKVRLWKIIAERNGDDPIIRWSDEETLGPNTTKPGILKR